jgi:hypothetical protein
MAHVSANIPGTNCPTDQKHAASPKGFRMLLSIDI